MQTSTHAAAPVVVASILQRPPSVMSDVTVVHVVDTRHTAAHASANAIANHANQFAALAQPDDAHDIDMTSADRVQQATVRASTASMIAAVHAAPVPTPTSPTTMPCIVTPAATPSPRRSVSGSPLRRSSSTSTTMTPRRSPSKRDRQMTPPASNGAVNDGGRATVADSTSPIATIHPKSKKRLTMLDSGSVVLFMAPIDIASPITASAGDAASIGADTAPSMPAAITAADDVDASVSSASDVGAAAQPAAAIRSPKHIRIIRASSKATPTVTDTVDHSKDRMHSENHADLIITHRSRSAAVRAIGIQQASDAQSATMSEPPPGPSQQ